MALKSLGGLVFKAHNFCITQLQARDSKKRGTEICSLLVKLTLLTFGSGGCGANLLDNAHQRTAARASLGTKPPLFELIVSETASVRVDRVQENLETTTFLGV